MDELEALIADARKCAEIAKVQPSSSDNAVLFEMIAVLAGHIQRVREDAGLA